MPTRYSVATVAGVAFLGAAMGIFALTSVPASAESMGGDQSFERPKVSAQIQQQNVP